MVLLRDKIVKRLKRSDARANDDEVVEAWVASKVGVAPPRRVELNRFQLDVANAAMNQDWTEFTRLLRESGVQVGWDRAQRAMGIFSTGHDVECVVTHTFDDAKASGFHAAVDKVELRFPTAPAPVILAADAGRELKLLAS